MLGIQGHLAHSEWDGSFLLKEKFEKPASFGCKHPNAFWTSTLDEHGTSAWQRFCSAEDEEVYRFEVIGEPRIVEWSSTRQILETLHEANLIPEGVRDGFQD